MSTSSATDFDQLITETEIVFTASPVFEEHFSSKNEPASAVEATTAATDKEEGATPTEQDKAAKQQVERLKAKLETHQQLRSGDQQSKQLRFKQLVNETRSLNQESQKFNTQSAVLLSALTNLKSELENSEAEKLAVIAELSEQKKSVQVLTDELKQKSEASEQLNAKTLATQETSERLIEELNQLTSQTLSQQQASKALLTEFEQDRKTIAEQRQHSEDNSNCISELTTQSQAILERSQAAEQAASDKSNQLDSLLEYHQNAKSDIDTLLESLHSMKSDLAQEKEIQLELNSRGKAQIQQSEKLNEQQVTLIELSQTRHDELRNELEVAVETSKKYQSRLQQTEAKLKDACNQQAHYQEQYSTALAKLESNEALLKNAAKALAEANGQNGKFNSSISKFQHANEQSQQLVLRTQTTLESILSRNQLLERENKLLAQKVDALNAAPPPQPTRAPVGLGNLNDLSFPDSQVATPTAENKNGFYKLMITLAIIIPLSFIAHSFLSTSNAIESGRGLQSGISSTEHLIPSTLTSATTVEK